MHSIYIEAIEYTGDNYFYKNDNFHKGVNLILGENQHGKTTFTYLILYALSIDVPAFRKEGNNPIGEIAMDQNNYISLRVLIDKKKYTIQRKINDNVISVIKGDTTVKIYPINRTNTLYKNENRTFSDWILEELDIDIKKIENILSAEHYLNFDDLFRFSYYDQQTSKNQMISDFGVGNNIIRKSLQMKKFIFETLLSCSNNEYYFKQKELRQIMTRLRELQSEISFKEKMFATVRYDFSDYDLESIEHKLSQLRQEKDRLLSVNSTKHDNKIFRLNSLKKQLNEIQEMLLEYEKQEKDLNIQIRNAKRLHKMEKKEIETLEVLSTSVSLYENIEHTCPICRNRIHPEKNKCICGNKLNNNYYHFMYTNSDYSDILKSKVSANKTTLEVIGGLKKESEYIQQKIISTEKVIEKMSADIKEVTNEITNFDVEQTLLSINRQISEYQEIEIKLKALNKENDMVNLLKEDREKLEKTLTTIKERLEYLELKKYNALSEHIDNFQKLYNEYLEKYYESLDLDRYVKLTNVA